MNNQIKYTDNTEKEPKIQVGQFYREEESQQLYIVARLQPPGSYVLVSLTDGISWTEPTFDINEVYDSHISIFTLITDPFTVTPDK
jgi:hypothetical protein